MNYTVTVYSILLYPRLYSMCITKALSPAPHINMQLPLFIAGHHPVRFLVSFGQQEANLILDEAAVPWGAVPLLPPSPRRQADRPTTPMETN